MLVLLLPLCLLPLSACDRSVGLPVKLSEVSEEVWAGGSGIPSWVDGVLLRQLCGGLGPTSSDGQGLNSVFDCVGAVGALRVRGASVALSTRHYPTRAHALWAASPSPVAWPTKLSNISQAAYDVAKTRFPNLFPGNPNVDFWSVGQQVLAVDDQFQAMAFDPATLQMFGGFNHTGDSAALKNYYVFGQSSRGFVDADGFLWTTAMAFEKRGADSYNFRRLVFKTCGTTGKRTLVANLLGADSKEKGFKLDATTCDRTPHQYVIYPDSSFSEGLSPGVVVTAKYIIVPVSSYVVNPCFLYKESLKLALPRWGTYWWLNHQSPVRILLLDRAKGTLIHEYDFHSSLVTQVVNGYEGKNEDDGLDKVVLDVLDYASEDFYSDLTTAARIRRSDWPLGRTNRDGDGLPARLTRFTMSTSGNFAAQPSYSMTAFTGNAGLAADFLSINPKFAGQRHAHVYALQSPFSDNSRIVKYSLMERKKHDFVPASGLLLSSPVFVPKPGGTQEDDGVMLVTGLNSTSKRGVLIALDAGTMKELGRAEGKSLLPFGLHGAFVRPAKIYASAGDIASLSLYTFSVLLSSLALLQ